MILTCPKCATSYTVDASKIPPDGRAVRCADCGHRWKAHPTPEAGDGDGDLDVIFSRSDRENDAVDVNTFLPELESKDPSEAEGPEISKIYRAKKEDERRVRQAAATGIIWAGMAAALVVMLGLAAVFRINVVGLWPKTAAAYAWVGLPVNSLGLTIEGIQAQPSLQDGHAALSVTGVLRNLKDKPIEAPPLRVSLLNKAGKPVATKIAQPADAVVPAGETRHFNIALLDPPLAASQLEVAFAPEAARRPARQRPGSKASPSPDHHNPSEAAADSDEHTHEIGPALQEAKPLPESSPYALSPHD